MSARKPRWTDRTVELPGRGAIPVRQVHGPEGAPTLVLLHGLAGTGRLNWFTAIPALSRHFNALVVDHRGHGRGIRTSRFRLADCADDVMALADVLGIESVIAVGYSMGGPIAKLCWSRHPGRVSGLVLCATARHFIKPQVRAAASALMPGAVLGARVAPDSFRQMLFGRAVNAISDPERRRNVRRELWSSDPGTILQASRALVRFSSHDWVSEIKVPTAVLVMTRDQLVPVTRQRKLAAAIPGARVFEVDGDHLACVSAPDRFVPALTEACLYVSGGRALERTVAAS